MTPRVAGVAGLAFVAIGIVELALTGGAIPAPTATTGALSDYFANAESMARVVAVLSGAAGLSLLIFTVGLRHRIAQVDLTLGNLVLAAGTLMVAVAFAGQAVQQAVFATLDESAADAVTVHGPLIGHLFLFAVLAGGGMAATSGLAGLRSGILPRWLSALGLLVLLAELFLLAAPTVSGAAFPVFLLWLIAMSIWMVRLRPDQP